MIQPNQATSTLRLARVTHVYPEGQSMDVIFLDTGDYGRNIQVMSPMAGTDFGFTSGIPSPEEEGHEANLTDDPGKRTITCVVASAGGVNICMGFLYPQVNQMAFDKESNKNRMIERHPSDFYRSVSDAGDADWVHPSGARLRIGSGEGADDLAGKDFDQRWALKHNTSKAVTVTLWNAGSKIQIQPNGSILLSTSGGAISLRAGASIMVISESGVTWDSPGTIRLSAQRIDLNPGGGDSGGDDGSGDSSSGGVALDGTILHAEQLATALIGDAEPAPGINGWDPNNPFHVASQAEAIKANDYYLHTEGGNVRPMLTDMEYIQAGQDRVAAMATGSNA